jgi:hypothetical protein
VYAVGNVGKILRLDVPSSAQVTEPISMLNQNFPNPFNPITTICFTVAGAGRVTIGIYDVAGALINTLVDRVCEPGAHDAAWDGRDHDGKRVSSGVYFYRLAAGDFVETRKMVLLQ